MRLLLLLLGLLLNLSALAADYAREKKWADEILPAVLTGDPVYLEQPDGHKFLGLHTSAASTKTAAILAHGIGVHPDWGLIGALRQRLAESGVTTLSIQMPVLKADAKGEDYVPTFDLAARRLQLAVDWLKAKGYARIFVVSHSLGSRMSYRYLSGQPDAAVAGWVAISPPTAEDYARVAVPVLDIYGDNDLAHVLRNAATRAQGLTRAGSRQARVEGADHFFEGKDEALFKLARAFIVGP
jgi:pimeloyl-ACP methyl ester carboxylesterase